MSKDYVNSIVKHYEDCLEQYGDTHLGVDWPKLDDVAKRYRVMLDMVRVANDYAPKVSLLDFGCGAAHLIEFLKEHDFENIEYSGLDISEKFIALCKTKYPDANFYLADILDSKTSLPNFDYIIMNGVFTEKRELSFDDMWEYFCKMITKAFAITNKGLAFNVMSKAVEWEREDLFHLPADILIDFLTKKLTRNFIIRNDYGLYEFTTYIYK